MSFFCDKLILGDKYMKLSKNDIFKNGIEFHYAYHHGLSNFIGRHSHDFFEIFVVMKGQIKHERNGVEEILMQGDMTLVLDSDVHSYDMINNEEPHYINLAFTKETLQRYCVFLGFESLQSTSSILHLTADCFSLIKVQSAQAVRSESAIIGLFVTLLLFWKDNCQQGVIPVYLVKLKQMLSNPESFQKDLRTIFSVSNYSYEHASRMFEQHFGILPSKYFVDNKLSYARNLLRQTNHDIQEISFMCGFSSLSHFYKLFKETFGVSPRQYRMKCSSRVI